MSHFMRAHGFSPGPTQRPLTTGAIAGAIGGLLTIPLMSYSGAIASLADSVGSNIAVVLPCYIIAFAIFGIIYGAVFRRAANDHRGGWLFGISYGFLTWMFAPTFALRVILERSVASGVPALGFIGAHLVFGFFLGLLFPPIHHYIQRRHFVTEIRLEQQAHP